MTEVELRDGSQQCPGCGETITFKTGTDANGNATLDVSHPQPPCSEFRAFIERLFTEHRKRIS